MSVLKTVELTIEKLAVGGDGLAFLEGRAVFVPHAIPGETVRAELTEGEGRGGRDWASAVLREVLKPSPDRVEPVCPLFGVCGGCSLQNMAYPRQVREKVAVLRDCLARAGGIEAPDIGTVPSPPYGYRNRMQFHLAPSGRIGFKRRGSDAVVEASRCPVAVRLLEEWMAASGRGRAGMRTFLAGRDRFLAFADPGRGEKGDARVYLEGRDGAASVRVAGRSIEFHVKGFFQSNLAALEVLAPEAVGGLEGDRAADLYCGVGLFGAFLKDGFRKVACVEHNPFALEYARRNVGDKGEYHDLAVEEWVRSPAARARFDAVVLDPPRSGLAPAVREWLGSSRIPRVSYVSCDPATLARDLRHLAASGYEIESLRVYDFFPQTGHVETHARLRRP